MRARAIDLNYRDTPNIFQNIVFLLFIMDPSALKMYCKIIVTLLYTTIKFLLLCFRKIIYLLFYSLVGGVLFTCSLLLHPSFKNGKKSYFWLCLILMLFLL